MTPVHREGANMASKGRTNVQGATAQEWEARLAMPVLDVSKVEDGIGRYAFDDDVLGVDEYTGCEGVRLTFTDWLSDDPTQYGDDEHVIVRYDGAAEFVRTYTDGGKWLERVNIARDADPSRDGALRMPDLLAASGWSVDVERRRCERAGVKALERIAERVTLLRAEHRATPQALAKLAERARLVKLEWTDAELVARRDARVSKALCAPVRETLRKAPPLTAVQRERDRGTVASKASKVARRAAVPVRQWSISAQAVKGMTARWEALGLAERQAAAADVGLHGSLPYSWRAVQWASAQRWQAVTGSRDLRGVTLADLVASSGGGSMSKRVGNEAD